MAGCIVWLGLYFLQFFLILPLSIAIFSLIGEGELKGKLLSYVLPSVAAGFAIGTVVVLWFPKLMSSGRLLFLPPFLFFVYGMATSPNSYAEFLDPTLGGEGSIGVVLFTVPAIAYCCYSLAIVALDLLLAVKRDRA